MGQRRRAQMSGRVHGLPSEYQEVEYLESTMTQYIDTNYIVQGTNIEFYIEYMHGAYTNVALFGSGEANGKYGWTGVPFYTSNVNNRLALGNSYSKFTFQDTYDIKHKYKLQYSFTNNNYAVEYDGTNVGTGSFAGELDNYSVCIFAMRKGTRVIYKANMKLYKFIIKSDANTKHYFIPCYRVSDTKPGLYDTVTQTFFTNQGTGEFILGPDV